MMTTFMMRALRRESLSALTRRCEGGACRARKNKKTLLLTIHLDALAMMPCNPSIGGTGKGHLVREIDALGGQMGKVIDKTFLQNKMLNTAKGAAVHSLRAQADKEAYHDEMKRVIERTPNLDLKQHEVVDLVTENGVIKGVVTKTGARFQAGAVILASGTYLKGRIVIGESSYDSGPGGLTAAAYLSDSLRALGFEIIRLRTGTPARVNKRSIDYSKLEAEYGDDPPVPFSFDNFGKELPNINYPCYLTYTNQKTHDVIKANLHRSPLFSGDIKGAPYCPSIEDKVVRFADKGAHQLFSVPKGSQRMKSIFRACLLAADELAGFFCKRSKVLKTSRSYAALMPLN
jgi:tRNA uridine 5-carboxymethylaminomethyl modification enzyme